MTERKAKALTAGKARALTDRRKAKALAAEKLGRWLAVEKASALANRRTAKALAAEERRR